MKKTFIFLLSLFSLSIANANPPLLWNGSTSKLLTKNLNLFDQAYVLSGSADPSSSATNGPAGSVYLASSGTLYIKQDAGTSTNWTALGSGSLTFSDSLVNTAGTVTLVGDSASPGNSKYYGTNGGGTLGFYASPAAGANTTLSNLGATAINANLIPGDASSGVNSALTFGTSSLYWGNFFGTAIYTQIGGQPGFALYNTGGIPSSTTLSAADHSGALTITTTGWTLFSTVGQDLSLLTSDQSSNLFFDDASSGNIQLTTGGKKGAGARGSIKLNAPLTSADGDIQITTAGKGLQVKEGSNARMGVSALSGGTVTVSNTSITANSRVFLSNQGGGTAANAGAPFLGTVSAGTSFVIKSSNALDDNNVAWMIIEKL